MPTIVTHGFVVTLLGKSVAVGRMPARFWILSVLCAVLPDADVLGFPLGIRYEDLLGHRGLSHSLIFAFVLSWIVAFVAFPRLPERWTRYLLLFYFFVVTASHGALDAMTDGGLGIAFFAPFDNTRYFFPLRPIKVSPIGLSFFSARGLDVIWSEFLWLCIPATIIASAVLFCRKLHCFNAGLEAEHETSALGLNRRTHGDCVDTGRPIATSRKAGANSEPAE
jgi:inner membrane protein